MGLEDLNLDVLFNIFAHLTESQARPHPHHFASRPPVFPRIDKAEFNANPKAHPYFAVAGVSRTLNRAIEAYAKHLLAVVDVTEMAPWAAFRTELVVAAMAPRCPICLTAR